MPRDNGGGWREAFAGAQGKVEFVCLIDGQRFEYVRQAISSFKYFNNANVRRMSDPGNPELWQLTCAEIFLDFVFQF